MPRGDIVVRLIGDTKDIDRKLNGLSGRVSKFGTSFGSIAKGAAVGLGAATAGVGYFGVKAVQAFGEAEAVGAQTAAVIKSTGGAAQVTAGDIGEMARTLSQLTAFEDEAIQSSSNVLATFTNIQNAAGKGNDVFSQSQRAILDLSQALGQDLQSSTIQVGKALNDPIKGIGALRRVGVSFTEQQQDQIKAMAASGDVMGAQKLILAELTKEFGGSAEAFAKTGAGAFQQFKNEVGNAMEEIGGALAPVVKDLLSALRPLIPVLGKALGSVVKAATPIIRLLTVALAELVPMLAPIIDALADALIPVLRALLPALGPIVAALAEGLTDALIQITPALVELALLLADILVALTPLLPPLIDLILLTSKWTLAALKPLIALIRAVVVPVLKFLVDVIAGVVQAAADFLGSWERVKGAIGGIWESIKKAFSSAVDWIGDRLEDVIGFFTGMPERIARVAAGMWDGITDAFKSAINWIIDGWNGLEFKIPGFDPPGPGPKFGGFTLGVPDIPRLADGGIVTRPTLAMVGEAGPEAVIPLRGRMGGGNAYYITVNSPSLDPRKLSRTVVEAIRHHESKNGTSWRRRP